MRRLRYSVVNSHDIYLAWCIACGMMLWKNARESQFDPPFPKIGLSAEIPKARFEAHDPRCATSFGFISYRRRSRMSGGEKRELIPFLCVNSVMIAHQERFRPKSAERLLTGDLPLGAYNDTITNDVHTEDDIDENTRAGTPICSRRSVRLNFVSVASDSAFRASNCASLKNQIFILTSQVHCERGFPPVSTAPDPWPPARQVPRYNGETEEDPVGAVARLRRTQKAVSRGCCRA